MTVFSGVKNIQLLKCMTGAEDVDDVIRQLMKLSIGFIVRGIFCYRIVHPDDDGIVTILGKQVAEGLGVYAQVRRVKQLFHFHGLGDYLERGQFRQNCFCFPVVESRPLFPGRYQG